MSSSQARYVWGKAPEKKLKTMYFRGNDLDNTFDVQHTLLFTVRAMKIGKHNWLLQLLFYCLYIASLLIAEEKFDDESQKSKIYNTLK